MNQKVITYDVHMTGKGSAGGAAYDLPASDQKDQTCDRPDPTSSDPTTATTVDVDVDAGGIYKGKVSAVHSKSEGSESWASARPFEAALKLTDGSTATVHCTYVKSVSDANGIKATTELLGLQDFPTVTAYMRTRSEGSGMKSDTTSKLQSIK